MEKSVRFSDLVKKSGAPSVAIFWADPRRNNVFSKAVQENRVLTVTQENVGNKMDYGTIGYHREKNVSYLVFPKPLPDPLNTRVVGIKYELLERPKITKPLAKEKIPHSRKPAKVKLKQFCATVRRTSVWETNMEVAARNKTEAKSQITKALAEKKLSDQEAVTLNEILVLNDS